MFIIKDKWKKRQKMAQAMVDLLILVNLIKIDMPRDLSVQ